MFKLKRNELLYIYIQNHFPILSILTRRIVIDDNLDAYVALLDEEINVEGFLTDIIVIMPKSSYKNLNSNKKFLSRFF